VDGYPAYSSWLDANIDVVLENVQMAQEQNIILYVQYIQTVGSTLENPSVVCHVNTMGGKVP
jgi:hypothetical protein